MFRPVVRSLLLLACWLAVSATSLAAETVSLTVDYGGGKTQAFDSITFRKGMTVLAAMNEAKRGDEKFSFAYRGRGETAFLTGIGGVANGGDGDKNWKYRVNGRLARQSFALQELTSGDKVEWEYSK